MSGQKHTTQPSSMQLSFIDEDNATIPTREAVFDTRVRKTVVNGQVYRSILDVLSLQIGELNPSRSWMKAKALLEKQGMSSDTDLVELQFPGERQRKTPAATYHGFLRIAQVIDIPDWENIRQGMADNFEIATTGMLHGKELVSAIEPPHTFKERKYRDRQIVSRGMNHPEALKQLEQRRLATQVRREVTGNIKEFVTVQTNRLLYPAFFTAEHAALFRADLSALRVALGEKDIRDALPPLELQCLITAEMLLSAALAKKGTMTQTAALQLVRDVVTPLGDTLAAISEPLVPSLMATV